MPVEGQAELEQGTLQVQFQLLAALVAAGIGLEQAEIGFAAAQAGSDQRQGAILPGIEVRLQVEAGDVLLGVGDLLSLEVQPALRRREAASQVEASVEATEELRPKLAETVQGDVQAALQALVERPAALNLVIPQAQVEVTQRPALPLAFGARLE